MRALRLCTQLERRLVSCPHDAQRRKSADDGGDGRWPRPRALLDTGSRVTTINDAAARRLGLGSGSSRSAQVIRGEAGIDVIAHSLAISGMIVGSVALQQDKVLVAPIDLPFADMTLGADSLQHRDIWLSYDSQQAFIR